MRIILIFLLALCVSLPAVAEHTPLIPLPADLPAGYFPQEYQKALLNIKNEKFSAAIKDLQQTQNSLRRPPSPDKLSFLLALAADGLNDREETVRALEQSLFHRRANSDVLYALGLLRRRQGDNAGARIILEEALWFGKTALVKPGDIWQQLGYTYADLGEQKLAAEAFAKALQKGSTDPRARIGYLDMLIAQESKDAAISAARDSLKQKSDSPELRLRLARALLLKPDRTFGKKSLVEARKISEELYSALPAQQQLTDPVFPVYIKALIETGDLDKAAALLSGARSRFPKNEEFQALQSQLTLEQSAQAAASAQL